MSDFQEFGFGAGESLPTKEANRFKPKTGESNRLSFVWWPGLEAGKPDLSDKTPRFLSARRLYLQGVGYFLDKGSEYQRLAGGQQGKLCIATAVIVWPLMPNGAVDMQKIKDGQAKVCSWTFGGDKLKDIEQKHMEFPLGEHDLKIMCTDAQYQKMTFTPCKENVLQRLMAATDPVLRSKAESLIAVARDMVSGLRNEIARDLTLDQINEKLGRTGNAPTSPNSSAGMSDFIDELVTTKGPAF